MHACIERNSRDREIHTPDEWLNVIKTSKSNGKPYVVNEVTQDHVFDFKALVAEQQQEVDVNKKKIPWSKIKEIHADSKIPNVIKFKLSLDEDYNEIKYEKKNYPVDPKTYQLIKAHTGDLGIPKAKLNDLLFLCRKNAIRPSCHEYFHSLTSSKNEVQVESDDE